MDKIDFVMIWVDGADPAWRAEKNKYDSSDERGDNTEIRYRSWDNLQYWFRGIEKFAPWVNRIHFVTWGHLPAWINKNNPKLNIVNHKDYIPEKYLPTFNANTIELNLHRIKGLSEQFVYFNDDMFVTAPVKPEDFFRNGRFFDLLAGNGWIRQMIKDGATSEDLKKAWAPDVEQFLSQRKPYLLYEE